MTLPLENIVNGAKEKFKEFRNAAVLTGGILAGLAGNANADNNIYVDVDPTLGPASSPVIDMTDYVVQGYLMNETETERTVGLRIYKLMPDGTADPDHFEIRKVLTLGLNEDATVDDLATVPRTEGLDFSGIAGQLPEYFSGLFSNLPVIGMIPDMPHTMYIDTSTIPEGTELFNSLVDILGNFNQKLSGYESVMPNDIINIETYVGNGSLTDPSYPEGFDVNNFRNSIVVRGSTPGNASYDFASKTLGIDNWNNSILKQEVGRAVYPGATGTIDSAATGDTEISALDIIGLRFAYDTDVQGPNGETRKIYINDLFEANQDDGSNVFPYGLPADQEMAPLNLDADGSANYQIPLVPVSVDITNFGSVKAMFR